MEWMEWPAEVPVATPFKVRMLVSRPGCYQGMYRPGVTADQSAVTFAPYFLVKDKTPICLPEAQQLDIYYADLDTIGMAPGLPADFARTFEMRAPSSVYAPSAPGVNDLPIRTYGDVTVQLSNPNVSRRNTGGFATIVVLNGCLRVLPVGSPGLSYVMEDQADTTTFSYAFIRGYIQEVATPVCGETTVFELLSRN
ncbi:MAG TPA: hypothetical protein VGU74_07250 [Gemmatimonadales bacterium]|nr:hypothetical protein [Gemmatimonadales bacterium]